jgi:hypothetical protein
MVMVWMTSSPVNSRTDLVLLLIKLGKFKRALPDLTTEVLGSLTVAGGRDATEAVWLRCSDGSVVRTDDV